MPKNKHYMDRLLAIHEKLSTGQRYTFAELRAACERMTDQVLSEKTLYNDLGELRELGAPIPKRDRSGRPYYYEKPFSLYGILNPTDAALANEAVALIRQMQTLPQFAGLESVMLRFEQQAGVIGKPQQSVVQFEQNPQYKGLRWLPEFYKAIQDDKPVRVDYTEFGEPQTRYQLSPYLLKEFNNRWYVYGWIAELNGIRNLALDRIDAVKPYVDLCRRPDHTDWDTYLADVVGVTRFADLPIETWILRVWMKRALYVETKPIHSTQTVVNRTDDFLDFQYELIWNNEFDAKMLELGADAELLAPAHHRARLAGVVKRMGSRYGL
jgi:predicted DNA-binding transcriptional regulator YafY